jgi:hypothetical protein
VCSGFLDNAFSTDCNLNSWLNGTISVSLN